MNSPSIPILANKYYNEQSVFLSENLLREGRRQKGKQDFSGGLSWFSILSCNVPSVCLLDPDRDLKDYLVKQAVSRIDSAP